ncbi:MAG: inositol monophosphatase family protein [Candidatus Bathyarchaeia archaeon]
MEWLEILRNCRDNIKRKIEPFLGSRQPQQCLGVGAGGDPIKIVDIVAEEAVVETLIKEGVSFTLISEETGVRSYGHKPKDVYVTIDPIDGTTNFTRGIPFYATSIAVSSDLKLSTVFAAMVADLFHNEMYVAQKGQGAMRNENKISPSSQVDLEEAVIGIDLNTYKVYEVAPRISRVIAQTKHIRHLGANALELCYVADGRIDSFIDLRGKLRATDVAAAWLVIKEAGGEITNPEGRPLDAKLDPKEHIAFIASGNKIIHSRILELLMA